MESGGGHVTFGFLSCRLKSQVQRLRKSRAKRLHGRSELGPALKLEDW